jgi:MFS family permease
VLGLLQAVVTEPWQLMVVRLLPGVAVGAEYAPAFTNALQGNLTAVYPAEVFPTELRSTGIGFSTACSRIGAASGTFLLPIGIATTGIGPCMLIAAGICLLGGTVSPLMAPETTGLSLSRTAALRPGDRVTASSIAFSIAWGSPVLCRVPRVVPSRRMLVATLASMVR